MHLRARSPAARRLLTVATSLPFDHPAFSQDVMEARCKPVGYYQMHPDTVGHEDVYNTCLLRWGGARHVHAAAQHCGSSMHVAPCVIDYLPQ
jgi:hypothetical protein